MMFSKDAFSLAAIAALLSPVTAQWPVHDGNVGPRDRFWRHSLESETLMHEGVNYFADVKNCLDDSFTSEEKMDIATQTAQRIRRAGLVLAEDFDPTQVFLVQVKNAILPIHVKAIQNLASCAREILPHLYESRPMYQERNLDEDPGLGGNCPTHIGALVPIFLPEVVEQMQQTLETAYEAAGWEAYVEYDRHMQASGQIPRAEAIHSPANVGIRACEHLTYRDFPTLADHTDGEGTVYTMNFAFSDEYEGGEYYILSNEDSNGNVKKHILKPEKYDALVFLGGKYLHGVQEILGGVREMFSTEYWPYPDSPFGTSLWTNMPPNMETHIVDCNREMESEDKDWHEPCNKPFPSTTPFGLEVDDVRKKYGPEGVDEFASIRRSLDERPNRIHPQPLVPIRFQDENGREWHLDEFRPQEEEPYFLIPKKLEPGEMAPVRWRHSLQPVDGDEGESFVIGFPHELHQEFKTYVENSGMLETARNIIYDDEPLVPEEHKIFKLKDNQTWGAMIQGTWNTDMVWLDPADEECFESLLSVLRRGGFDKVLEQIGNAFDLQGLMIQGVGAIFLSEYEFMDNIHVDIEGSKGSFYNVIVPVYIPEDEKSALVVTDYYHGGSGSVNLDPNMGLILGGESPHGTAECNYREKRDVRLSFAVYLADINDNNVDLIASDSTSLWPTKGDTEWFRAQRGRLWSKDGNSLRQDKGRQSMKVEDIVDDCNVDDCVSDAAGKRLQCPKTCRLYLNDEDYFPLLTKENVGDSISTSSL
eukprot:Nitzschia sp. Nitz4//scaffold31_size150131//145303//147582//NITZ4_002856-RA/size150131-processed-gene-0.213-mRNA-1//1//CDS//3329547743//2300//frame0